MAEATQHLVIKTIEHKGVEVSVRIDFDAGTVSLVEKTAMHGYQPKNWVFANRSLNYMDGWLKILEAMTVAVKELKKDLEHDLAEKSKFREEIEEQAIIAGSNLFKAMISGNGGAGKKGKKKVRK